MIIKLEPYEIMMAAQAGCMRLVQNIKRDRTESRGSVPGNGWQRHIEGALAEYALAKHLNIHWAGKGVYCGPDVGIDEVRCTHHENGRLIIHENDNDAARFWFLVGVNGTYEIKGWLYGSAGKRKEYWKDPGTGRPAYFIPAEDLNPVSDV